MTIPGPQFRKSAPAPEIVQAFEDQCNSEHRSSGAVLEALMLAYRQMTSHDRGEIAEVRRLWYEKHTKD